MFFPPGIQKRAKKRHKVKRLRLGESVKQEDLKPIFMKTWDINDYIMPVTEGRA